MANGPHARQHRVRGGQSHTGHRRLTILIVGGLLATVAMFALARSTSNGLGFSPDSVSYYAVAQGILAGKGLVDARRYDEPSARNYPPGYSALIAVSGLLVPDLRKASRALHLLLIGLATALLFLLGYQVTGSPALGAFCALVSLGLPDTFSVSRMMWSEPAFTVAVLAFTCSMLAYITNSGTGWLVAATVFAATAASTRMPGVSLAFSGGLCVVFLSCGSLRQRLIRAGIFGAVAIAPTLAWLVRNKLVWDSVYADRPPDLMAFSADNLMRGAGVVSNWTGDPTGLVILFALLLAAALSLARGQAGARPAWNSAPLKALCIIVFVYFAVMVAGVAAYGLAKPFDPRFFFPIAGAMIATVVAVFGIAASSFVRFSSRFSASARFAFLCVVIAGLGAATTVPSVAWTGWSVVIAAGLAGLAGVAAVLVPQLVDEKRAGVAGATAALAGFLVVTATNLEANSRPYDRGLEVRPVPAIIADYRRLETKLPVFSNYDDRAYMFHERPVRRLPRLLALDRSGAPAPNFDELLREFRKQVEGGAFVLYILPHGRFYLPDPSLLAGLVELEEVHRTSDGVIYRILARSMTDMTSNDFWSSGRPMQLHQIGDFSWP